MCGLEWYRSKRTNVVETIICKRVRIVSLLDWTLKIWVETSPACVYQYRYLNADASNVVAFPRLVLDLCQMVLAVSRVFLFAPSN